MTTAQTTILGTGRPASPTGVCVFKTRSEEQAKEIVGRKPERLEYREHRR